MLGLEAECTDGLRRRSKELEDEGAPMRLREDDHDMEMRTTQELTWSVSKNDITQLENKIKNQEKHINSI